MLIELENCFRPNLVKTHFPVTSISMTTEANFAVGLFAVVVFWLCLVRTIIKPFKQSQLFCHFHNVETVLYYINVTNKHHAVNVVIFNRLYPTDLQPRTGFLSLPLYHKHFAVSEIFCVHFISSPSYYNKQKGE